MKKENQNMEVRRSGMENGKGNADVIKNANAKKNTNAKNEGKQAAGYRILAKNVRVLNDSMESGLSGHDIVCGRTGAGKTSGYVETNIASIEHSMVIMDTKGRLHKKYRKFLENKGFKVVCVDFIHPENSEVYNPLDYVHVYSEADETHPIRYRQIDLKAIAKSLVPDNVDKGELFWVDSCRNTLITLMAFVMETLPVEERHMGSVLTLYTEFIREIAMHRGKREPLKVSFFEQLAETNPESFAVLMYKKLSFESEKTWGCNEIFVGNALEIFTYQETQTLFSGRSSLQFADLGREKTVLFINTSDTNRMMDPIVGVFLNQLFQALVDEADRHETGELEVAVRLILDDFSCGTKINDFDKLISVIRSRRIYVSLMLQSITQLETIYEPSQAKTIVANCDCGIYIGSQERDTAEYLADIVGRLPRTILNMKRDEVIVLISGEKPEFAKRIDPARGMELQGV